jgi:hypothetical protein
MSIAGGTRHQSSARSAAYILGIVTSGIGAPSHADLYSIDVPGLEVGYGGIVGDVYEETEFDFGQQFHHVEEAWLEIEGTVVVFTQQSVPIEVQAFLDGFASPSFDVTAIPEFSIDVVFLTPPESVLDGEGIVGLQIVVLQCCDLAAVVTDATLWFDAIPLPQDPPIPTVSAWGLALMALLVLTTGTLLLRRIRVV